MATAKGIALEVDVKVSGGIFHRNIPEETRLAFYGEAVTKISDRWMRGGRGQGVRRNTLRQDHRPRDIASAVHSTLRPPRTTGAAVTRKKIGQGRAMAPRVLKKGADVVAARMVR